MDEAKRVVVDVGGMTRDERHQTIAALPEGVSPTFVWDGEGLRRQRVQRMNHAMRAYFHITAPAHVTYHHAPFCPQGSECCCSRKWVRLP